MKILLKGATIFKDGRFSRQDISVVSGMIGHISPHMPASGYDKAFNLKGAYVFPGFADVHVHLREPGFSYKETIETGTAAAARGGYTTICSMPNLSPPPDGKAGLDEQLLLLSKHAKIRVMPFGTITEKRQGENLSDMRALALQVAGFSDDGSGVQGDELMEEAMWESKALSKIIAAHAQDEDYDPNSSESEYMQLKRDLALVEKTGCAYHACHISTKESVELIRQAKLKGLDVSCEVTPHHLLLCDEDTKDDGRFKMNPPLRSRQDMQALRQGLKNGTIDMIATDHAPHSAEEKAKGMAGSENGVSGLECAFAVLYTGLVLTGEISLPKLIYLMSEAPGRRFGLEYGINTGRPANLTVFSLDKPYRVDPATFLSKGKSTPFEGMKVQGRCLLTLYGGVEAWGR